MTFGDRSSKPALRSKALAGAAALVLVATGMLASCSPAAVDELDQGWDAAYKKQWYELSQGSRLIPLAWLNALEQADNDGRFMAPDRLQTFGYIPRELDGNPLAVGFAVDTSSDAAVERTHLRWKAGQQDREPWVGMNCSACHTAELTFKGQAVRIDGGPARADFQSFVDAFNAALDKTQADPAKWERFAAHVLAGADDTPGNRALLKAAFARYLGNQQAETQADATPVRYGFSRVDAFGRIYNKVALIAGATAFNAPDAPVRYPYIWRAHQYDHVQYNGIAANFLLLNAFDIGALGRNVGEAIGVFGDVKTSPHAGHEGFASTIRIESLNRLEEQLKGLRPPKWPVSVFGPIAPADKPDLVETGRAIFAGKGHCASCHAPVDRTNLAEKILVRRGLFQDAKDAPGSDPWMACNAFEYRVPAGNFEGVPSGYFTGYPVQSDENVATLLALSVTGTLLGNKQEVTQALAESLFGVQRPPRISVRSASRFRKLDRTPQKQALLDRCMGATSIYLGYTSKPLNGIWAGAPYLHNGSVPTLYDLLLPPDRRPKQFSSGTREYDPNKVGYVYKDGPTAGSPFLYKTKNDDGSPVDGNWNTGHDYGNAELSDDDRYALIAYLKSL